MRREKIATSKERVIVCERPAEDQSKNWLAQKALGTRKQEFTVRAFGSAKTIFLLYAVQRINQINIPV